jgi:peptidoglycan/LPS O-acetylase OafA/YrhL
MPSTVSWLILVATIGLILAMPRAMLLTANAGYGIASGAIVGPALLLERNGVRLRWGWLQRTGDASYSIYLTHFFVTLSVERLVRFVQPGPLGTTGFVVIALALCAIIGFAIHRLVEQPLTRIAKQLWSAPKLLSTPS